MVGHVGIWKVRYLQNCKEPEGKYLLTYDIKADLKDRGTANVKCGLK
jgi:hypothetical protein